jgi:hypothetical protein
MKVAARFASEGFIMGGLNQWNDLHVEGGVWVRRSRVFLVFLGTLFCYFCSYLGAL